MRVVSLKEGPSRKGSLPASNNLHEFSLEERSGSKKLSSPILPIRATHH